MDPSSSSRTSLLENDVVGGAVDYKNRPVKRSNSGGWRSAKYIIGVEMGERFAYYGITLNLITYLTGPLGQSMAVAAANVNAWAGVAALLPLLGAFVADSYLGRYRTIIISSLLYILGLGLLTLAAVIIPSSSDSSVVLGSPPRSQVILFFSSLYLVAIAQGGHRPCVQAFGADQFDAKDPEEFKAKSSFFNWWFCVLCFAASVSVIVLSYIQDNLSWAIGFGIPCIFMCCALVTYLLGTVTYRFGFEHNDKNPFVRIGQVFLQAARNWRSNSTLISVDDEDWKILHHQEFLQLNFLNKALFTPDGSNEDANVCYISEVQEAKAVVRLFPLWATLLVYGIVFGQSSTLFTKQGVTLNRSISSSFQIPPSALQSFICVSTIILIPMYDRILVPIARTITGKPSGITTLQRIGVGMLFSIFSLIVAAIVERKRLQTALDYGLVDNPDATVPMSFWWLVPQYLLFGVADVFATVGMQEFFYDEVPSDLKSVGLALYLSVIGVGNFLSSFLITVIEKYTGGDGQDSWFSDNLNRAHLDYFYWLLGGLSLISFALNLYFAKHYSYNRGRIA